MLIAFRPVIFPGIDRAAMGLRSKPQDSGAERMNPPTHAASEWDESAGAERPLGESGWAFQPAALDLNVFWHRLG